MNKITVQGIMTLIIAVIFVLILTTCGDFQNGGETALSISLSVGSATSSDGRSAMPWPPDEAGILGALNYEITFTGNGQTINRTGRGGDTITVYVSVGLWNVAIEAFYLGSLYATGSNSVDVKAGSNNVCNVTMNKAFPDDPVPPPVPPVPNTYTVTFNSNGGSPVVPIAVKEGETINPLPTTTMTDHDFDGWNTQVDGSGMLFDETTAITADITVYAQWIYTGSCLHPSYTDGVCDSCGHLEYEIGDTGPGGGIIFYRSATGFTVQGTSGNIGTSWPDSYTAHYLEVSPANVSNSTNRGEFFTSDVPGITSLGSADTSSNTIGYGRKDTQIIVQRLVSTSQTNMAAQRAAGYTSPNGTTGDWFLPSLGELYQLYLQRTNTNINIISDLFWTSTQRVPAGANVQESWVINFSNGSIPTRLPGDAADNPNVRAIRAF